MFQLCDLQDEGVQSTVLALARKPAPTPDGGWFRQADLDGLRDCIKVRLRALSAHLWATCTYCLGLAGLRLARLIYVKYLHTNHFVMHS